MYRVKRCLGMPIDAPDSEFDCIGVNGEGPYNKAVVGGVIDVVRWIMLEPRMCQNVSVRPSHLQLRPEYKYRTCLSFPLSSAILHTRTPHHANLRKDPHRKDYHP